MSVPGVPTQLYTSLSSASTSLSTWFASWIIAGFITRSASSLMLRVNSLRREGLKSMPFCLSTVIVVLPSVTSWIDAVAPSRTVN
jgi:hypothetical protein